MFVFILTNDSGISIANGTSTEGRIRYNISVSILDKRFLHHEYPILFAPSAAFAYCDKIDLVDILVILVQIAGDLDFHKGVFANQIGRQDAVVRDSSIRYFYIHFIRSGQFFYSGLVARKRGVVRWVFHIEHKVSFIPLEVLAGVLRSPSAALELVDHGLAGIGDGDAVAFVKFLLLFCGAERIALGEGTHGGLDAHGIGVGKEARHLCLVAGGERDERKGRQ